MFEPFLITFLWGNNYATAVFLAQVIAINAAKYSVASPSVVFATSEANKGMRLSAISSAVGAFLGAGSWIVLLGEHPAIAIPVGLFISTVSIASIIYVRA